MKHLKTLNGNGRLYSGDEDFGPVAYRLDVWQEASGIRSSTGTLTAEGGALMRAAIEAPQLTLELDGGDTVTLTLEQTTGSQSNVRVSGPVPGVD